jgi:hypothetical protein
MVRAMDELPPEAAPVTVTVNQPPPQPIELTGVKLAQLARELVMDVYPLQTILGHFNLSEAQYDVIKENADFKRFSDQIASEWNSALSTPQRLKIQAAAYLEEALPTLAARMVGKTEDLGKANEIAKTLTKLAGIGDAAGPSNPGEKFNIVINLGADVKEINITKPLDAGTTPAEAASEAQALSAIARSEGITRSSPAPVQADGEGQSDRVSIFDIPTGPPKEVAAE